jgi:apolipoprotein D and lipocalin family protein
MKLSIRILSILFLTAHVSLTGCMSHTENPMQVAKNVDLERFMGDWYVIANIPTIFERDAVNPLESYSRNPDGTIATTFTFNKAHEDGPLKTFTMKGFPSDEPGIWGMQFVWPIKADYRIAYVDPDYRYTIVARNKRDYLWLMARSPNIDKARLEQLIEFAVARGYERSKIQLSTWQRGANELVEPDKPTVIGNDFETETLE